MGIEEICDKSNITATSENILLFYCVSDCLACTGLKTDASSLLERSKNCFIILFQVSEGRPFLSASIPMHEFH